MNRAKRTARRDGQDTIGQITTADRIVTVPADDSVPSPGRLGQLAAVATVLADGIDAANGALLSAPDLDSARFWHSLESAAEACRRAGAELETVAGELVRAMASTAQGSCEVGWGICPDHGIALTSTGEQVLCRVLGCHRAPVAPSITCTEPIAYRVVDAAGSAFLACTGHAVACRRELVGVAITLTADSLEHL